MNILGINVRSANVSDIVALSKLEQRIWTAFKTEVFTETHFQSWLEVYPEGFLVAEKDSIVVGYIAYQKVVFDPIGLMNSDYNLATDNGFIRRSHNPNGDCYYVVSACSENPGAGFALVLSGQKMTKEQKLKCAIAFCRIPGFSDFFEEVQAANQLVSITKGLENELALWYSIETAKMVNGRIGDINQLEIGLSLPVLKKTDPVIGKVLRYPGVFLAGVSARYMKDPLSRHFGAFTIFDYKEK